MNDGLGIWLGLLTAVLYAFGVLTQKVALRRVDVPNATFLGAAIGAMALLPFAPQFVHETATAPAGAFAGVIYLGVFPTAIAFSTWGYALARTDAGRMIATTLTVPAIAIVLSWIFLGSCLRCWDVRRRLVPSRSRHQPPTRNSPARPLTHWPEVAGAAV